MKNKKLTYALLTGVLMVWGFVLYQLLSGLGSEDNDSMVRDNIVRNTKEYKNTNLKFALNLSYRDPFLGKATRRKASKTRKKIIKTVIKKEPEPKAEPIDLSFVKFIGTIQNQKTGKQVSLMTINGTQYFMNEGDAEGEIQLIKNFNDSIHIEYLKKKYFIRKN